MKKKYSLANREPFEYTHFFCLTPQKALMSYPEALAHIRRQYATAPAAMPDYGMVRNNTAEPSQWLVFQVQDGTECEYCHIQATPHTRHPRLERAISCLNFLANFHGYKGCRVGLRKMGQEWLVFQVNEQKHQQKPLTP